MAAGHFAELLCADFDYVHVDVLGWHIEHVPCHRVPRVS
jgi:hypothetical protein